MIMPYFILNTIEKRGDEWVLLSSEGKVLGRHDTKEQARQQERAIKAAERATG